MESQCRVGIPGSEVAEEKKCAPGQLEDLASMPSQNSRTGMYVLAPPILRVYKAVKQKRRVLEYNDLVGRKAKQE